MSTTSMVINYPYASRSCDPGPALAHLKKLVGTGLSLSEVARRAGVDPRRVTKLYSGGLRRGTCRIDLADAILAVPVPTNTVSTTGTRRRLQALVAIGYELEWLAEQLPTVPREVVIDQTTMKWAYRVPHVASDHADAVTALYERLYLTPGPSTDARQMALGLGWASSLAWDSHDALDDPKAKPQGVPGRRRTTKLLPRGTELPAIVADHRALRHSDEYIAEALGVELESLRQAFRRNGIEARYPDQEVAS